MMNNSDAQEQHHLNKQMPDRNRNMKHTLMSVMKDVHGAMPKNPAACEQAAREIRRAPVYQGSR